MRVVRGAASNIGFEEEKYLGRRTLNGTSRDM
jgi:hypothetical protein